MRVHISTEQSNLNTTTTVKYRSFHRRAPPFLPVNCLQLTRKREGEGRAALLQREGKVTASVAACTVGAMMSLPL